jgi:hypothetical protein
VPSSRAANEAFRRRRIRPPAIRADLQLVQAPVLNLLRQRCPVEMPASRSAATCLSVPPCAARSTIFARDASSCISGSLNKSGERSEDLLGGLGSRGPSVLFDECSWWTVAEGTEAVAVCGCPLCQASAVRGLQGPVRRCGWHCGCTLVMLVDTRGGTTDFQ